MDSENSEYFSFLWTQKTLHFVVSRTRVMTVEKSFLFYGVHKFRIFFLFRSRIIPEIKKGAPNQYPLNNQTRNPIKVPYIFNLRKFFISSSIHFFSLK